MASQPNQVIKRIGTGAASGRNIDTIPGYTTLTGTVSSNSPDTKVLSYTGTDNWLQIFNLPQNPEPDLSPRPNPFSSTIAMHQERTSRIWLYILSPTPFLVPIIGIANTGTNTWALQSSVAVPDLINTPCNYVLANLRGYFWNNDGGGAGTVNNISVSAGDFFSETQLAPKNDRGSFWDPVLVNATGTSFYVVENR